MKASSLLSEASTSRKDTPFSMKVFNSQCRKGCGTSRPCASIEVRTRLRPDTRLSALIRGENDAGKKSRGSGFKPGDTRVCAKKRTPAFMRAMSRGSDNRFKSIAAKSSGDAERKVSEPTEYGRLHHRKYKASRWPMACQPALADAPTYISASWPP